MSKKYTLEEKRRAIEQYGEKINYSARYSGEFTTFWSKLTADDEWEYR